MIISMNNIILIGMAGSGKSSVGVILAKKLGFDFLDTDLVLQRQESRLLWQILSDDGLDGFYRAEEKALLSVTAERTVIATGGSAIYYENAMNHLKELGVVVWLKLPYEEIERRINNLATRGVAMKEGMTLRDVFDEREPLYRKYADITIECAGITEHNAEQIIRAVKERLN